MSNNLSSSDLVNPPIVPQRSAAIVSSDGRWALYHETIHSPDIPETSYYVLELGTGITIKLPKSAESAPSGSTLTNFIWADKTTLLCQAQMNQTTYFFTLKGPLFAPRPAGAARVDTLLTILKVVFVAESDKQRRIYVAIAVSGIGAGTTSARSNVSEVDGLEYSSRPGGQVLRCLVFLRRRMEFPYVNFESISSDILETINLKYVPFPTQVSMGPRNFDLSRAGLALVAQTEEESQAQHDGISDVYFIPFDQLPTPKKSKELAPLKMETTGITGSASVPVLKHDTRLFRLAFLKRCNNSTERGTFIFKVNILRKTYQTSSPQRVLSPANELNFAPDPVYLAWAGPSKSKSKRLFYWSDNQMSIVEISIPLNPARNSLFCSSVIINFDHGSSILGVDCLKKLTQEVGNPGLLISRALADGSTDFLIYNADTGDRSIVQRASIGGVMTEQEEDDSNETGGNFGNLTEDGIENRGEVPYKSDDIEDRINEDEITEDEMTEDGMTEDGMAEDGSVEDRIVDDRIIEDRGVGDESNGIEDMIFGDGSIEDRIVEDREVGDESNGIEDMIFENGFIQDGFIEDMIIEDRGAGDESNGIEDRIIEDRGISNESNGIEDREEVIHEGNGPEDGVVENSEESGNESEDESLEPPFPALENRGGQADSILARHAAHMLVMRWLEERRSRGLSELSL